MQRIYWNFYEYLVYRERVRESREKVEGDFILR